VILETLNVVAALMGYDFSDSIFLQVAWVVLEEKAIAKLDFSMSDMSASSVLSSMSLAVKEGFVERTRDGYQFTHDKLQSALPYSIGESEEAWLHLLIGEAYLKHVANDKSNVYKAAVHLSCAPGFLYDRQQQKRLARINLDAARYCMEISAFDKSVDALVKRSLHLLGDADRWSEDNYTLTFEVMKCLARAQLVVIGEFKACKNTTREALGHDRTAQMKMNLQLIAIEAHMAENAVDERRDQHRQSSPDQSWSQVASEGEVLSHCRKTHQGKIYARTQEGRCHPQPSIH
jgi:hypothetical protein